MKPTDRGLKDARPAAEVAAQVRAGTLPMVPLGLKDRTGSSSGSGGDGKRGGNRRGGRGKGRGKKDAAGAASAASAVSDADGPAPDSDGNGSAGEGEAATKKSHQHQPKPQPAARAKSSRLSMKQLEVEGQLDAAAAAEGSESASSYADGQSVPATPTVQPSLAPSGDVSMADADVVDVTDQADGLASAAGSGNDAAAPPATSTAAYLEPLPAPAPEVYPPAVTPAADAASSSPSSSSAAPIVTASTEWAHIACAVYLPEVSQAMALNAIWAPRL